MFFLLFEIQQVRGLQYYLASVELIQIYLLLPIRCICIGISFQACIGIGKNLQTCIFIHIEKTQITLHRYLYNISTCIGISISNTGKTSPYRYRLESSEMYQYQYL